MCHIIHLSVTKIHMIEMWEPSHFQPFDNDIFFLHKDKEEIFRSIKHKNLKDSFWIMTSIREIFLSMFKCSRRYIFNPSVPLINSSNQTFCTLKNQFTWKNTQFSYQVKNTCFKMFAQWLRVVATLTEDLTLVPTIHIRGLIITCNWSLGEPILSFGL